MSFLKFFGCGNAFSINEENTSAYFTIKDAFFLIDCGGTVFKKIIKKQLLVKYNSVYIILTHTHFDHIGSLGDFLLYLYFIKNIKPIIIFPDIDAIKNILHLCGIDDKIYQIVKPSKNSYLINEYNLTIQYVRQNHIASLNCFGYIINFDNYRIFYSGDSRDINNYILDRFLSNEIQYFYQDTCSYKNHLHLFIEDLFEYIPLNFRNKVYCMHYDDNLNHEWVIKNGFNIVKSI
ncbi:MBL fold metallo-hydrolase [Caldicellulosiruptoraceae bacterium PP1]